LFQVYAGLDLFRGRVARLVRGRPEDAIFYPGSAEEYAGRWVEEGADWLHVVDLDAALGVGDNLDTTAKIAQNVKIPVQVGGGVRSLERARRLVNAGVNRVIISSMYFRDRVGAMALLGALGPGRVAVSLDVDSGGYVVVAGWMERTGSRLGEAVERAIRDGFTTIMVTNISRDGTLRGIDTKLLQQIPQHSRQHIVVAGGVTTAEDVLVLRRMGFAGAVLGRALYEGFLDLKKVSRALDFEGG